MLTESDLAVPLALAAERQVIEVASNGRGGNIDGSRAYIAKAETYAAFKWHGYLDTDGQLRSAARERGLQIAAEFREELRRCEKGHPWAS